MQRRRKNSPGCKGEKDISGRLAQRRCRPRKSWIAAVLFTALAAMAGCGHKIVSLTTPPAPSAPPAKAAAASAAPQTARTAAPKSQDKVAQLVARANALYSRGMAEYQAGDLESARKDLDGAIDVLLESGLNIRSDDRLNAEFEKLVQNTYDLEVATLSRGEVLSERPYAPPPIESLGKLTFPVNPAVNAQVNQKIKTEHSDLPLVSNDAVDGVIAYMQSGGRGYIETILRRIGKYQPMISKILRKEGVPQDLIYDAAAESGFNPFAVSSQRCVGIWQFGLGTARLWGLTRTRWVDQRSDPVLSTEAAAAYLKSLYQEFGDWYLALAAYDSGELTVQRAIERTGYADYWKLRELHALPLETQNYVPIFLATAIIAKDPAAYGFDVTPDPPIEEDHVEVGVPTDLRLVAELVGSTPEAMIQLNPSLLRWTTPADDPHFVLNIPKGTTEAYEKGIALIPRSDRVWWRVHAVQPGETLASIASANHLSLDAVERANSMQQTDSLTTGELIALPFSPGHYWALARAAGGGIRRLVWYRIRPGDSLGLIADRFGLSAYEIRRWNHLRSSTIIAGHSLRLYVLRRGWGYVRNGRSRQRVVQVVHLGPGVHYYRIRRGDNLDDIAGRYGVTVSELRQWNELSGSNIVAGRKLKIVEARRTRDPVETRRPAPRPLRAESFMVRYRIRRGDNLQTIARRYGVGVRQIMDWNHLHSARIVAGRTLEIALPEKSRTSYHR